MYKGDWKNQPEDQLLVKLFTLMKLGLEMLRPTFLPAPRDSVVMLLAVSWYWHGVWVVVKQVVLWVVN